MAASKDLLHRIRNSVTTNTITVQHVKRDSITVDWKDATIVDEMKLDIDLIPNELTNGNEMISAKTYGVWKALQERCSDSQQDERFDDMRAVYDAFCSGVWKEAAQPRSAQLDALFVQAIANLRNLPTISAQAALQACSADERKQLRDAGKVRDEIARLKAETSDIVDLDISDLIDTV